MGWSWAHLRWRQVDHWYYLCNINFRIVSCITSRFRSDHAFSVRVQLRDDYLARVRLMIYYICFKLRRTLIQVRSAYLLYIQFKQCRLKATLPLTCSPNSNNSSPAYLNYSAGNAVLRFLAHRDSLGGQMCNMFPFSKFLSLIFLFPLQESSQQRLSRRVAGHYARFVRRFKSGPGRSPGW